MISILALLLAIQSPISPGRNTGYIPVAGGCGGYAHYRFITVPAQTSLSGNLTNYPLVISGTYSYLATVANGGLVQNASGFDIGFFTDDTCTTKLNWETETYTAANGLVNYWVQVPTISQSASITFVLAYDNASISTDQSTPTGVWDSNFAAVWHWPNGTTLTTLDSTGNGWNGTPTNASASTGKIDGAAGFVGTGNIDVGGPANAPVNGKTYEAWVYATSFANAYNSVISKNEVSGLASTLLVKSNGKLAMYLNATGGVVDYDGTGAYTLSTNTWYLVDMTYDSVNGLIGYVNGSVDGSAAANGTIPTSGIFDDLHFADHPSISGRNWNGSIDEGRVSIIGRSADWVLTDYNSQNSPSTFYSIGIQH